jgi:glutamyl-tRNA reductase
MSVLVVGLSHKGAPLATLERVALAGDDLAKLLHDVARADDVAGALVLSTCNRVEIYAEVGNFHGTVAAICELLSRHSHVPPGELTPCLYVHYEDRAIQHLLAVACGLDSMVIGESQILGQLRRALRLAREQGTLGRALSDLGSLALRAGKRAHGETGVGAAGASLVSVGLQTAAKYLRPASGADPALVLAADPAAAVQAGAQLPAPLPVLAGQRVVVVGAGAMSGLVVASVARQGPTSLTVVSRTRSRAERLAVAAGGRSGDMSELPVLLAEADLVVTCTGAPGHVITTEMMQAALRLRGATAASLGPEPLPAGEPPAVTVVLDLAMPRDVEPDVGNLTGVVLTDLDALAASGAGGGPRDSEVAAVRGIIAAELAAYVSANRAASVAPTVVALRAKAARVVESELARLFGRLERLDAAAMDEVAKSMRRVTDKLLHDPTVRMKELAGGPGANTYEDALRVLFDLDPATVQAVAQADAQLAGWPPPAADQEEPR